MATKMLPLEDRVVVRREEAEERTSSGLYIPEQSKEKPFIGVVQAVGYRAKDWLSAGDRVMFSRYGGVDVKSGDQDLIVMRLSDIMAVVVDD